MLGLRTNESNKFIKYFEIVQATAHSQGCVYFLDAGDGRDFENGECEGEDLMGWLIPVNMVSSFEQEWNNFNVLENYRNQFINVVILLFCCYS